MATANEQIMAALGTDETLAAFMEVVSDHAKGVDAGPKVLLELLKEKDAKFADVSAMKIKKMQQKLRQAKAEAIAEKEAEARLQSQVKSGQAKFNNCPGKHGLVRCVTHHEGFGCNVCGKKRLPIGAVVWQCRQCNYDVCDEKCYKFLPDAKPPSKAQLFEDVITGLNHKVDRCIQVSKDKKSLVKILELVTQEVDKHEKGVQEMSVKQLVAKAENENFDSKEEAKEQRDRFLRDLSGIRAKIKEALSSNAEGDDNADISVAAPAA